MEHLRWASKSRRRLSERLRRALDCCRDSLVGRRIKNSWVVENAPGGPKDVLEGKPDLVGVPRASGRRDERGGVHIAESPDDEHAVGEPDEGGNALDCLLLSGRGVAKPEELLQISEADFDGPAVGVGREQD